MQVFFRGIPQKTYPTQKTQEENQPLSKAIALSRNKKGCPRGQPHKAHLRGYPGGLTNQLIEQPLSFLNRTDFACRIAHAA